MARPRQHEDETAQKRAYRQRELARHRALGPLDAPLKAPAEPGPKRWQAMMDRAALLLGVVVKEYDAEAARQSEVWHAEGRSDSVEFRRWDKAATEIHASVARAALLCRGTRFTKDDEPED